VGWSAGEFFRECMHCMCIANARVEEARRCFASDVFCCTLNSNSGIRGPVQHAVST